MRREESKLIQLDPTVLDEARARLGLPSDEKLGGRLELTGTTVRNLRHGRTSPSIATLVKLRALTGRTLDSLIVIVPDDDRALTPTC